VILLDTSVLSAALRRKGPGMASAPSLEALRALLRSGARVAVPGIVVQEVLSGVRERRQFDTLKSVVLAGYPVLAASVGDHVLGAQISSTCRRAGVAVATVDALIAAQAVNGRAQLFSLDADCARIARHVPLRLFDHG
jgi:hypothetical protein